MKTVTAFTDFICPYCYIGKARLERIARDHPLKVEWKGMEIHPEIPPEGIPLDRLLPRRVIERGREALRPLAREENLEFKDPPRVASSRLALELGELATDHGKYAPYSNHVFEAYFTRGENIGDPRVLRDIAGRAGLDPPAVEECLRKRTHRDRVEKNLYEATCLFVSGVPTFFVSNGDEEEPLAERPQTPRIVGVHGEAEFRRVLEGKPLPKGRLKVVA